MIICRHVSHVILVSWYLFATPVPRIAASEDSSKPAPLSGQRGTVEFWQKELSGKFKPQIKAQFGTPTGGIEQNGDIYVYTQDFFHPDLDQWRDLRITFSEKDGAVESFTGSGGDSKSYQIKTSGESTAENEDVSADASPSPTPDFDELKHSIEPSVITVEFTESAGRDHGAGATGFIVEREGKKFIVTNIHVLQGEVDREIQLAWHHGPRPGPANSPRVAAQARVKSSFEVFQKSMFRLPLPPMKSLSGQRLNPSPTVFLSQSRDIGLLPVITEERALKFSSSPPKRGKAVIILGNPEAGHTLTALEAEISSVGPDRFELDRVSGGEIVPGMSGGPVVDAESGEVIGIVTYMTRNVEWVGNEAYSSAWGTQIIPKFEYTERYFAYRCDNLSDLQQFSWDQFVNDSIVLHAMKWRTFNVYWAKSAYDAASGSQEILELTPDFDNKVQITYASFVRDAQRMWSSSDYDQKVRRWQEYQRRLETLLENDLEDVNPLRRIVTPYLRRELDTTLASDRRKVVQALREQAGKVQVEQ
jgi:hypothetical protein